MRALLGAVLLGAVLLPAGAGAAEYRSKRHAFALVAVSEPLDQAWGLAFLPDGRMLVTEKAGNLRIVRRDGKVSAPLGGLPRIEAYGQGGLLDVVLHPNFAANRLVKGWTEALQLMNIGSVYRLVIPSELGYGARGAGQEIGPHAVLIFEVHLMAIETTKKK